MGDPTPGDAAPALARRNLGVALDASRELAALRLVESVEILREAIRKDTTAPAA